MDSIDRFGLRRAALDWRLSEVDLRTVRTAAIECGRVLAKRNAARVKLAELDEAIDFSLAGNRQLNGANHHMCTARRVPNPRQGVVDAKPSRGGRSLSRR
jgi:hypothetical protein